MSRITSQRIAGAVGRLPVVSKIVRHRSVRRLLEMIPGADALYGSGWDRVHPFDQAYGTDTSGFVAVERLPESEGARVHAICYAGSQPSLIRRALQSLPPLDSYTFVDLGCGKGRALLVASEFPFREILGVELSAPLAKVASRNAARFARSFPERPRIVVAVGDASVFPLPDGNVVLFLYHPFGAALVAQVVAGVEIALAAGHRRILIVYYNPVAGHCFDASPLLHRRFARTLPYAAEERGYGPDQNDVVVIWQGAAPSAAPGADARIVLQSDGLRVALERR